MCTSENHLKLCTCANDEIDPRSSWTLFRGRGGVVGRIIMLGISSHGENKTSTLRGLTFYQLFL